MQEITSGIFVEKRFEPYNLGLIALDKGGLVIDVPPRAEDAQEWLKEAQDIAGPIHYIVLTDAQPGRLFGPALFHIPIIATEEAAFWINTLDEKGWQESVQAAQEHYGSGIDTRIAHHRPKPTIVFNKRLHLHRRSPSLEFESVAGAGKGSLWLLVPDQKILFAGDTIVTDAPPMIANTPDSKAWLNTLAMLSRRTSVQKIVQGRGTPVVAHGDIESQREFMRVVRHTARGLAKEANQGEGLSQATKELQQAFFPSISKHSDAMQRLQKGLAHLIAEVLEAKETAKDIEDDDDV